MWTSGAETTWFLATVAAACAKRTGAAASVERRRREPVKGDPAGVTYARQCQSFSRVLILRFVCLIVSARLARIGVADLDRV